MRNAADRGGEGPAIRLRVQTLGLTAERRQIQGRYGASERLYRRALTLAEEVFPDDLDTAALLNGLGVLHKYQGRYDEAEPVYRRAPGGARGALGPGHPGGAPPYHHPRGLGRARGNARP